jgi:hypothetical protein
MKYIYSLFRFFLTPISVIQSIIGSALLGLIVLTIPFTTMRFTHEVNWEPLDFGVAWFLIFGTGISFHFICRTYRNSMYKIASALAVCAGFAIIWVNGAVGIIGNEENPINLLFGIVLLIMILGSHFVKRSPRNMAWVMLVTATSQIVITLWGTLIHLSNYPAYNFAGVIRITLLSSTIWGLISLLYYKVGGVEVS